MRETQAIQTASTRLVPDLHEAWGAGLLGGGEVGRKPRLVFDDVQSSRCREEERSVPGGGSMLLGRVRHHAIATVMVS